MKKYVLAIILFAIVLSTSCKDKDKAEEGRAVATPAPTPIVYSKKPFAPADGGFVFVHNGTRVILGTLADEILQAIGEVKGVFEAPSCAFDGIDKTFFYNDFYIETFPWDDDDYLNIVHFQTDGVGTAEGLYIGMDVSDMIGIYGDDYKREHGMYTYEKNGTELAILIDDDEVVQITYYFVLLD